MPATSGCASVHHFGEEHSAVSDIRGTESRVPAKLFAFNHHNHLGRVYP
jgi:hypothetical protein